MAVGVDEARDDDRAARVDDLGVLDAQIAADRCDHPVLDQHLAALDFAQLGVHRDDEAAGEQDSRCYPALIILGRCRDRENEPNPEPQTWILTGGIENFEIYVERNFDVIGLKEKRVRMAERMEPGDEIVFYVTGVKAFGAIARITSPMFEDREQIWPQGKKKYLELYPWRVNAEPLVVLEPEQFVPASSLLGEHAASEEVAGGALAPRLPGSAAHGRAGGRPVAARAHRGGGGRRGLSEMPRVSVLDLSPVAADRGERAAVTESIELAEHADRLGYHRIWFAEHHGGGMVSSSAPELMIAAAGARTERIRLGSGGMMLPNHTPLARRRAVQGARSALSRTASISASAAPPVPTTGRRWRCAAVVGPVAPSCPSSSASCSPSPG